MDQNSPLNVPCNTNRPCISTPLGEELKTNQQPQDFPIQIQHHTLKVDLIILLINHFDVIIGMDWLTKYRAEIRCTTKTAQIISATKARKLIQKKGHLYQLVDVTHQFGK